MDFITSNLSSLKKYLNRLLQMATMLEQTTSLLPAATLKPVHELKKQLKIDFIREDAEVLIAQSLEGGMKTLAKDGIAKVVAGDTTVEELLQVHDLQLRYERSCTHCHRTIAAKYRFCPHCGRSKKQTCPQCQTPLEAEWNHCPNCRTAILAAS
ncbi:MAG: zinc ribbon domain-containing protein [Desulfuromonas sp.]|nr:zinc ribbon domain-containing protein [Desulfuromonas sp.]